MNEFINVYKDKKGKMIALVIKEEYSNQGIDFLTNNNEYMQVAYMGHPENHEIIPHYHNIISRKIDYTCETLIMRKGIMQVDLFDNKDLIYSFNIKKGDVISLFGGGHGFKMIENVEMIEIKQGPFLGQVDKTRF